jgi:hypothetical protein
VDAELIHANGHEDILLEATKQRTCFVSLPAAAWMSELYFHISQCPNETPKISVNVKYSKVQAPPI